MTSRDQGLFSQRQGRQRRETLGTRLPLSLGLAGHVITQKLGGKKSVGREGWQSVLIVAVVNFVGFKISSGR